MKLMLVDHDPWALWQLKKKMKRLFPEAEMVCTVSGKTAMKHRDETFTAVFLKADANGLRMVKELTEESRRQNIILIAEDERYAMEAFKLRVSGYITRPFQDEDILKEMKDLRYRGAEV